MLQEHNLSRKDDKWLRKHASACFNMLWLGRYREEGDETGNGHGTAIIIPHDMIHRKKDETVSKAIARVTSTLRGPPSGRITAIKTHVGGKPFHLVSAYAGANRSSDRASFFTDTLEPLIFRNTILGIDANCVPDIDLDTLRPGVTSCYENSGATELATIISDHDLTDVARDQLGNSPFFTSHHFNVHGLITRTRIDQLYAPLRDALLWTHTANDTFRPPPPNGLPDHVTLEIKLDLPLMSS